MNILVINGHPDKKSFNASIFKEVMGRSLNFHLSNLVGKYAQLNEGVD